jgi:hypothetical protein
MGNAPWRKHECTIFMSLATIRGNGYQIDWLDQRNDISINAKYYFHNFLMMYLALGSKFEKR